MRTDGSNHRHEPSVRTDCPGAHHPLLVDVGWGRIPLVYVGGDCHQGDERAVWLGESPTTFNGAGEG